MKRPVHPRTRGGPVPTLLALLVLASGGPALAEGAGKIEIVRYAVIAGNNDGGDDVVRLRYAERDAERFADVLRRLGGVPKRNLKLLLAKSGKAFVKTLGQFNDRIARAAASKPDQIAVFMVYFSGHAKDGNLRFGDGKVSLESLKNQLSGGQADVRIGILDACRAGEITRLKGGQLAPPFLQVDDQLAAAGHVLITSSSAKEDSQESDELGGSFFTHYLLSGLRGAADVTGDGAVTLAEAYQYAYHRTVERTAGTRGGTQHPEYRFELQGRGDMVLTRVGDKGARLLFPASVAGDFLIYDLKRRVVVAEVNKTAGEARTIAVAPGRYVVKKRRPNDVLIGRLDVRRDSQIIIEESTFEPVAFEDDYTKGAVALVDLDQKLRVELSPRIGFQGFFDSPTRDELFFNLPMASITVEIHNLLTRGLSLAIDVSFGAADGEIDAGGGVIVPVDYAEFGVGVGANYRFQWNWFGLYLGPRLAFLYMARTFDSDVFENWKHQDFSTFSPGAILGLDATVAEHWRFRLEGRVHYLHYNVDGDQSLGYGEAFLAAGYVF